VNHPTSLETPANGHRIIAQRKNCISDIQAQEQMLRWVRFNHTANVKDKLGF
jgi:hypothetical protein